MSQQGGIDESGAVFVVLDGDRPLQVGRAYLFVTRTNPATGWHTAIPKYGDVPAATPQAQALLVQRFTAACAGDRVPAVAVNARATHERKAHR